MIPDDPYGEIQMLVSRLPDSAHTIVAKSKEFRASGEVDFALELLGRAIGKDRAPILLAEKADLRLAEDQWEEAIDLALEALEIDQRHQLGRGTLRKALLRGLPESAPLLVRTALVFVPDNAEFAERLLMEAIEQEPENLTFREQSAQLHAAEGRVAECIAELQEILVRSPEHADALLMLTASFVKQGDYPRAQKNLNRARALGSSSPTLDELQTKIESVVGVISRSKKP